jgi:hypothetical protein
MNVIHITCEAPPERGGIAQYLRGFIDHEERAGLHTDSLFVIRKSFARLLRLTESPSVFGVPDHEVIDSILSRVARMDKGTILFHYSGYGYHHTGAPSAVIDRVIDLKRACGWSLVTLFHETYASSYPWRRAFWYSPFQMYAARRLARSSSISLCTTSISRQGLLRFSGVQSSRIQLLAIPATIGEASKVVPWPLRQNSCILFGRRERKQQLLREFGDNIQELLARLGVKELVDVGERIDPVDYSAFGGEAIPLRSIDAVENVDILREFMTAKFFLIDTPPAYLDKSTVFANGVANGCIPIWVKSRRVEAAGQHILDLERTKHPFSDRELTELSEACRRAYLAERSWAIHMNTLKLAMLQA